MGVPTDLSCTRAAEVFGRLDHLTGCGLVHVEVLLVRAGASEEALGLRSERVLTHR